MISRLGHHYNANKTRIHRLTKEGGWIMAGQIASVLGALVLVRVLTEYLEPAEYGQLALGLTIAGLVNQVVMGGTSQGISRYYSIAYERKDLSGYLKASRHLLMVVTIVVVAIAVACGIGLAAMEQMQWIGLVFAVLLFSIFSGYNGALSGIQNAARQRAVVALHAGMDAWLKIGLAVGFMLWLGSDKVAVVLGYFLSALLITGSQLFFLKRTLLIDSNTIKSSEINTWSQQIWAFSWPFSAWGVFTWAQQASDRWALQAFATTADVGQYAVVYQLGFAPIGFLVGLMVSLVAPILYQRAEGSSHHQRNKNVHRIIRRIVYASLALTVFAFLLAWGLHDWLFQWLVAENYQPVSRHFPWMILAGGLFATGQMLSLKLMAEIKSHQLLYAKIGSAIIGIAANFFGAWWFGFAGVVFGLVTFSAVFLVWVTFASLHLPEIGANENAGSILK